MDAALSIVGRNDTWLCRKIRATPFSGRPPRAYMIEDKEPAMAGVLRHLTQAGTESILEQGRFVDELPEQGFYMLSFHSDPAVKAKYLARVEGHAAADEIIKGRYWEAGKGCAVGCTIHGDSHEDFELELGIPQMLAWLEDVIFEGLPNRLAKTWPERFLSSIDPGRNLTHVSWELLHWLLTESSQAEAAYPIIEGAVSRCADILVPLVDGRPVNKDAAEKAAALAWAAVETVEGMASASARPRWIAESAARAAESAALTATSAALSAERAATAVSAAIARSADFVTVSEKLLELLRAA